MSAASSLRCLLIDDHALFADAMALLLGRLAPRVTVDVAPSCEHALELLARGPAPDLILFDLALPGTSHIQAFQLLHQQAPGVPIVAVSADDRPRVISDLVRAGARGYVPKSTNAEVTLSALRLVLAGGTYVPETVVFDAKAGASPEAALTARELQVLGLVAGGHGNKVIAQKLGMAESTVRVHVTSILRRLGVSSRVEAVTSPVAQALLKPSRPSGREP